MSGQIGGQNSDLLVMQLRRRSTLNRPGYSYVLEAARGYYCLTLVKTVQASITKLQMPISPDIFDIIVEYIYTSRVVSIPIRNLVKLFAVANLLELDEVLMQLEIFFSENSTACLESEEFLVNESFEDVAQFLTKCLVRLSESDRLMLVQKIYRWAAKHFINSSQVAMLAEYVCNTIPGILRNGFGKRWPHTTALLVTTSGLFHGPTRVPCSEPLRGMFSLSRNPILICGDEVFMNMGDRLSVYGIVTGLLLRTSAQLGWVKRLVLCNDKVYTWNGNRIFEIITDPLEGRIVPYSTRSNIDRLHIINDDQYTLQFYYNDTNWRLYVITCYANGLEISDQFITNNCYLIGAHGDSAFIWTRQHQMKVFRRQSCIFQYDFFADPSSAVSCGSVVYLKFDFDLKVVETDTHLVSAIACPPFNNLGRLIVRGTFQ